MVPAFLRYCRHADARADAQASTGRPYDARRRGRSSPRDHPEEDCVRSRTGVCLGPGARRQSHHRHRRAERVRAAPRAQARARARRGRRVRPVRLGAHRAGRGGLRDAR